MLFSFLDPNLFSFIIMLENYKQVPALLSPVLLKIFI